ncbi:hypothetical protein F4808DRAFT_26057 [Astrocystis sublimbata]|nr:hypothetical protein F4808DRAFT_26057 [Astrocystis sublimbata]
MAGSAGRKTTTRCATTVHNSWGYLFPLLPCLRSINCPNRYLCSRDTCKALFDEQFIYCKRQLLTPAVAVMWPIPWAIRVLVGNLAYRNTVATLHGQGTGRFTPDEIAAFRREIWESFSDLLLESRTKTRSEAATTKTGPEPFWVLGGPQPTEADASLFGFVSSALICTAGPGSRADVKSFPVLLDYAQRIQEHYFPDYEAIPM